MFRCVEWTVPQRRDLEVEEPGRLRSWWWLGTKSRRLLPRQEGQKRRSKADLKGLDFRWGRLPVVTTGWLK